MEVPVWHSSSVTLSQIDTKLESNNQISNRGQNTRFGLELFQCAAIFYGLKHHPRVVFVDLALIQSTIMEFCKRFLYLEQKNVRKYRG